jgi:hypothetical protein
MAKVPLPERGQPLDVTYLYSLVEAVNDLSSQVSSATYNYTTIDTVSANKQNIKTSDLRIVGGLARVASDSTVSAGNEKTFTYDYSDFKYAPIVSATVVNTGQTQVGQNVNVILKPPTTSKVEGVVRFGTSGNVSLAVHLVIVGVPN